MHDYYVASVDSVYAVRGERIVQASYNLWLRPDLEVFEGVCIHRDNWELVFIFFEKLAFNQVHCCVVEVKLFTFNHPCYLNNIYPFVKTKIICC